MPPPRSGPNNLEWSGCLDCIQRIEKSISEASFAHPGHDAAFIYSRIPDESTDRDKDALILWSGLVPKKSSHL